MGTQKCLNYGKHGGEGVKASEVRWSCDWLCEMPMISSEARPGAKSRPEETFGAVVERSHQSRGLIGGCLESARFFRSPVVKKVGVHESIISTYHIIYV